MLLLSNLHHEHGVSDTPKLKLHIILDYNRHKCGVDILEQILKGHRPYRAIRRLPCVLFFRWIALTSQASYVLYSPKFSESTIAKRKTEGNFCKS